VSRVDLGNGSSGEGASYSCFIPGTTALPTGTNSSPVFALKDTTLICQNLPFKLEFGATDADGDSLSYSFCNAYNRGGTVHSEDPNYVFPPGNVNYTAGFTGASPLGPDVSIDPKTGTISGRAPASGYYVVTVCINEWRAGKIISNHRKDFALRVSDCSLVGAILKPTYITCDGFTMNFQNESTSSNISGYLWDFGENSTSTSTAPTPSHTYADTGTYTLKLRVTAAGGCQDSTTAQVRVYPGFNTDFNVQGTCYINSYQFLDATTTAYGVVDSWRWSFGDPTTLADTSRRKDTTWRYSTPQAVQVKLVTTNSKGCIDSTQKTILISDKPKIDLPFKDTLICSIDTLALRVNTTTGIVSWAVELPSSRSRILNPSSASPLVFPVDTTRYFVTVNDNGCINTDTVTVNVLDFIDVTLGPDTSICRTDTVTLSPVSDALRYQWTSSTGESFDASAKHPKVRPLVNTQYYVTANLGYCQDKDTIQVNVAPYPVATVGPDATICFGERVQISGTMTGASFSWSPANALIYGNTLQPIAGPSRTTQFILTVTDTIGCDKPFHDTLTVRVIPPLAVYAGKDTAIAAGYPLQLMASGGQQYVWTPNTGLDNPNIANPIATLPASIDSIRYVVRASDGNCYAEDDIVVRVFKNGPDIYVPSAFTPNGDGKNDVVMPVAVSIAQLQYFRIFNRWGQLVFSTSQNGKGWDGMYNGVQQPAGTYVYETVGLDSNGNTITRKGTIVLIR
jgi:gliding motility-associated-like protein